MLKRIVYTLTGLALRKHLRARVGSGAHARVGQVEAREVVGDLMQVRV